MAIYQVDFNTQAGWKRFTVEVDEDETLDTVLPDILHSLEDYGLVLEGQREGRGDILVTCDGRELNPEMSLPEQGVRSHDVLKVTVGDEPPALQLRRQNQVFDIIGREELVEGDDLIVGKTILRFRVGKQRQQIDRQATFIERLQEGRSFKQTVYFMTLVGAIAGLACWLFAQLLAFALDVEGRWVTVINFSTLGAFIGALTIGFNDKWLGDRVVGRWVMTGALAGAVAGACGGLLALLIHSTGAGRSPLLEGALSWMLTGALIGFAISMRWFSVNKNRVLHGLFGGLLGGLLGGLIFWSLGRVVSSYVVQALSFIVTGAGITFGISLAPILFRKAVLEFVSSGDRQVLAKYARSRKQWEIHHGGKYIIGSLSAAHTHTMYAPEVQIYIPDQLVEERHAVLLSKGGKYYVEPHPALSLVY